MLIKWTWLNMSPKKGFIPPSIKIQFIVSSYQIVLINFFYAFLSFSWISGTQSWHHSPPSCRFSPSSATQVLETILVTEAKLLPAPSCCRILLPNSTVPIKYARSRKDKPSESRDSTLHSNATLRQQWLNSVCISEQVVNHSVWLGSR